MESTSRLNNVVKKGDSYIIKGIVKIPRGQILTLKDIGLIFEKDCALVIEGKLIAENTIFTSKKISNEKDGWPNSWLGLIIKGKAIIKNCIFEKSISGLYILNGKANIQNNKIRFHRYGIRADNSKLKAMNNEFRHCSDAIFLYNTKALIKNNLMQNNGCGIYAYYSKSNIQNNNISVNEKGYKKKVYSGIYSYNSNLNIKNNNISGPYLGMVSGNSNLRLKDNKVKSVKKFHEYNFVYESLKNLKKVNFISKQKIKTSEGKDFLSKEISRIFNLCIKLKRGKETIREIENYLNNDIWKLHPCLDIPFSYIANAYSIYHNKNKKRILRKRIIELGNYLEWWLSEVGGANNHQDLLAASSLGIAALEFANKKSKRWLELANETIKKPSKDYIKTEAPLFLSDLKQYLEKSGFED